MAKKEKSKFLAEGLVLQAVEEGMDAKIYRLGRLVGRASDGVFQRNPESNVFYLILKGFSRVGAIPVKGAEKEVDLMPVDVSVEEVLALKDREELIFHIMNHTPPILQEVMKAVDPAIETVSDEEFAKLMEQKAPELDKELSALLMDHWHRSKTAPPVIQVSNELTVKYLEESGYIPQIPGSEQILKGFYLQNPS